MNKQFSRWRIKQLVVATVAGMLLSAVPAHAGDSVPDWFRQLAHETLPKYSDEADAVVLLDEETLTIRDNGEIYDNIRRAVKILRPGGKRYGTVSAYFDKDTKLESIHGWSISATGQEYELKQKDAIETSPYDGIFTDTREKRMTLPALDVGTYVAFEYQQRRRPYAYGDSWWFQQRSPVRTARYSVNLPAGWEYQYHFANWTEIKPTNAGGNNWTWEVHDVPGIEHEPSMPAAASIEGRMVVSFYSASLPQAAPMATWNDVGRWANSLNASRRLSTPKIQAKVAELSQGKIDTLAKMHAMASYVQHQIRYVAIEIGIGGFQAHMAGDIFSNGYGDCKDKATLLVTMLHEAGIESYLVLVHDERGVVNPANPTPWTFNHVIVAIKVPADVDSAPLFATVDDPKLGKLLFFDPTNDGIPFGFIPGYEQNSYGLLVSENGGEMVKMPVLVPAVNRMLRVAHLQLSPNGSLSGEVKEIRSGEEAWAIRSHLASIDRSKRQKYFESFLSEFLDQSQLTAASISGLDQYDEPLILEYKFVAPYYAKSAGDLLLVRPRVLGQKASTIAEEKKDRKYPISFENTWLQSDLIDIKLPPGYKVDELPNPVEVKAPFAEYKSKTEVKDDVLYYNRSYERKDLIVPLDQFATLRTFMRGIAADERNTAVLKKAQP